MMAILCNAMTKRRLTVFTSSLVLCLLSGCSTIQFVQHEQMTEHTSVNRWHHLTLNGTVELSPPLDIQSICGKKAWTTITTELTPYNVMAVVFLTAPSGIPFYSAWTNRVQCYQLPTTSQEAEG